MALLKEASLATQPALLRCVDSSLELRFAYDTATRCTLLSESLYEPPLKVVRAFTLADGAALGHLHNVSGGLLGDDRLTLSVRLDQNAKVQLTTTGATRIYRAREKAGPAIQRTEISLAANALLEYLPDPIIPFAHARFSQQTEIQLASGAGLFWWEILAPGREASGELFAYDSVEMKADLRAQGRLIAAERVRLEPHKYPLSSPARLGAYRYWATFYICRVGLDSAAWLALEERLREAASKFNYPGKALWGISTLLAHGLVCRCVTLHGRDVMFGLNRLWREAKLALYGAEAVPPRKVN
ncbi:MAG TPA: urease accessory protein UreD [Candidatus Acidoferrales bacterium]|nr:urease accessory protein UreD [Candidatus Acidoferrum sp.]HUJ80325.1 urease accessory protein UreD [Candidatus Acidoferrales bacterium]